MIYVSQEVMQLENWKELIADFLDEKKMDLLRQYYYITHIVT